MPDVVSRPSSSNLRGSSSRQRSSGQTWRACRGCCSFKRTVGEALERLDPLWEELFPAEQARIIQLLVQRVDVMPDGLEVRLRAQGLGHVVQELGAIGDGLRRAA